MVEDGMEKGKKLMKIMFSMVNMLMEKK